jgi:hypothetical protein
MKFSLFVIFLSLTFVYLLVFAPQKELKPIYNDVFAHPKTEQIQDNFNLISDLNNKKYDFKNVYLQNIEIIMYQNRIPIKLSGFLAYEKSNKFRLQIFHRITGIELDVGSNSDCFWFQSKRTDRGKLYVSKFNKPTIYLRSALDPDWILQSTNLIPIDEKYEKIYLIENKYIIEQFKILSNKQSVLIKTLIDLDTKNILGRYLYDNSGVLIASAEYFDHHQFIPKKINIIWYEENIQMTWNIKNIQKNCNLPASLFKIPLAK